MEHGLEEHLAGIFPEQEQPQESANTLQTTAVGPAGQDEGQAVSEANAHRHRWIAQAGRQQREVVRWGYRRLADLQVSTTDPDASPMQHKNKGTSRLGYQTHYVVDGGKARVILDVLVTPAEVTENLPMLDLLFRSRFRWHLQPGSVTADAAYGTTQNIAAIEKVGIRAYLAVVDHEKRTSFFGRDAFTYDAQKDLYICPKGEILRLLKATTTGRGP